MSAGPALAGASQSGARRLALAQFGLLAVFVIALPLAEGPKNIAAALFALAWLLQVAWLRDPGGRWDRFDTAFAALLGAALLAAWQGGYRGGLSDVVRIVLLAWLVKRSGLAAAAGVQLLLAAGAALWLALLIGLADYARRASLFLELPSVGHVNQSALYIALLAAAAFAWALQRAPDSRLARVAVTLSAAGFAAGLFVSGSRAALLAYGVFVAGFSLLWLARALRDRLARRRLLAVLAAGALLLAGLLAVARFLPADPVMGTIGAKLTDSRSMPIRMAHWRLAEEGWRARPWFGFGPDAFHTLRPEQACQWRAAQGKDCDPAAYLPASHVHSLYLAAAVERGAVGVAALLLLLGVWGWTLVRSLRTEAARPLWAASAAGLVVVAVGGLFNTTLRVEHGSLALLMLALWLAAARVERGAAGPDA